MSDVREHAVEVLATLGEREGVYGACLISRVLLFASSTSPTSRPMSPHSSRARCLTKHDDSHHVTTDGCAAHSLIFSFSALRRQQPRGHFT